MVRRYIRIIGLSLVAILLLTFGSIYLYQMNKRGGFETMPDRTPLPALRAMHEKNILSPEGDAFSFAVLGDMRWDSAPRIAILRNAQKKAPLFMVNLGDVVTFGRKNEWKTYIEELSVNWNRTIPYFHIPGSHSINFRLDGVYPAFYRHYFGKTYYFVDVQNWRFIFLDTSKTYLPQSQRSWLSNRLEECTRDGKRAVIFTHCPPRAAEQGITHALTQGSTNALAQIIAGHDVAAIFAAHIHKTFNYVWNSIPVHIAALNDTTWMDNQPAEYLNVSVSKGQIKVKPIKIFKISKRRY